MSGIADAALACDRGREGAAFSVPDPKAVGLLLGSSWSASLSPRTHTASTLVWSSCSSMTWSSVSGSGRSSRPLA